MPRKHTAPKYPIEDAQHALDRLQRTLKPARTRRPRDRKAEG